VELAAWVGPAVSVASAVLVSPEASEGSAALAASAATD
jgi:hypothetical protein